MTFLRYNSKSVCVLLGNLFLIFLSISRKEKKTSKALNNFVFFLFLENDIMNLTQGRNFASKGDCDEDDTQNSK